MTEQRMSAQEAVALCRMAKAACPQQQFDQYTPDMWHELLGDLRFQDAKDALVMVVKRQPFVSPAEIRDSVAAVRKDRIAAFGYLRPPTELDDNWAAQQAWIRETKRAIGDGELKPGDPLEPPTVTLDRVMPDWNRMLPSPEPVSRSQVAAESRRVRFDPERMEAARAELGPAAPIPGDALTAADMTTPPPQEPEAEVSETETVSDESTEETAL